MMTARDSQATATNSQVGSLHDVARHVARLVLRATQKMRLTSCTNQLLSGVAIERTTSNSASFHAHHADKASLQGAVTPFNPHS